MRCPNCQRENEPTGRFCIFCGSLLPTSEAEHPSEPTEADIDTLSQQVQTLQQEIRRLSALITLMNDRLAAVERMQGIPIPTPEPTPAPPAAVAPGPEESPAPEPLPSVPATAAAPPEAAPVVERWGRPITEAPPPPPRERRPPTAVKREWEQILGGNWLARIGVFALIIGVGFFLKYAFDQNWLNPTARVILGTVAGLGMLGGGHYWQKRYPTFAQAISGGGVALLYLSIFAAFTIFDLIGFYLAVVLLLTVSVGSALLALRYNSMALAIIGIIGAFIAPFILAVSAAATSGAAGAAHGDPGPRRPALHPELHQRPVADEGVARADGLHPGFVGEGLAVWELRIGADRPDRRVGAHLVGAAHGRGEVAAVQVAVPVG